MNVIRLIIFIRLVLSIRFEYKFKTQIEESIAGNDLCTRVFGENTEHHWKDFKYYFSLIDPRAIVPLKKPQSNYKVQPFIDYIQNISYNAWIPGKFYFIIQLLLNYYLFQ